jgi:hypothetical protein
LCRNARASGVPLMRRIECRLTLRALMISGRDIRTFRLILWNCG